MGLLTKIFKKAMKNMYPKDLLNEVYKKNRHETENSYKEKFIPKEIHELYLAIDKATYPIEIYTSASELFQIHQNCS